MGNSVQGVPFKSFLKFRLLLVIFEGMPLNLLRKRVSESNQSL